jgi:hypothetical protein
MAITLDVTLFALLETKTHPSEPSDIELQHRESLGERKSRWFTKPSRSRPPTNS